MPAHNRSTHRLTAILLRLLLMTFLVTSCSVVGQPQVVSPSTGPNHPGSSIPQAEINFTVSLPEPLAQGQNLFIEILDEVTGLALNPTRIKMEASGARSYTGKAQFAVGSVVKYRYIRDNDPAAPIEYTTSGQQVRYRMYYVDGPGTAQDVIAGWRNAPSKADLGRIRGQVSVRGSNSPIVNALVAAGGMQTLTASDGTFLLEGLPPGTHNLVVYSLDGTYQVFQQGAVVAPDSTTPAFIQTGQANLVNVTFVAKPPAGNLKGVPVRLVGNTYSLGNTFADLRGGVSVTASRAPLMAVQEDGSYTLTLQLPAGLDLRYKYTLGDGFWNAEHRADGSFITRQLIVPDQDVVVNDSIETWTVNDIPPVTFTVTVPADTPLNDVVSIQFNPYGWTEPLPMWPGGNNRWFFILYSPLHLLKNATYRYCRSEQCGIADAADTVGPTAAGKAFQSNGEQKNYNDTVESWALLGSTGDPITVTAQEIRARGADFLAGAEFIPAYHPSWQPYVTWAFQNLKDIGANTVILAPTWHWTHQSPPVVEPVAGQDALWNDLSGMNNLARKRGLEVILHPTSLVTGDAAEWWSSAPRDEGWWQSWFDRYRTFLIYHADLAAQMGAKGLIIGDDAISPALPGGKLGDGSSAGVPDNAEERWSSLIAEVRARFSGRLLWLVPLTAADAPELPAFAGDVDQLYVRVSAPLVQENAPTGMAELEAAFNALFDERLLPLQEANGQPVVLSLLYPSAPGAAAGCVQAESGCRSVLELQRPSAQAGSPEDYALQAVIYSAALSNVNQRSWIAGFVSAGYYPATGLRDTSASVRSKRAADVLWYWFPRLTQP